MYFQKPTIHIAQNSALHPQINTTQTGFDMVICQRLLLDRTLNRFLSQAITLWPRQYCEEM